MQAVEAQYHPELRSQRDLDRLGDIFHIIRIEHLPWHVDEENRALQTKGKFQRCAGPVADHQIGGVQSGVGYYVIVAGQLALTCVPLAI